MEKLKIAIDYEFAVALARFYDLEYSVDGDLVKGVRQRTLFPSKFKNMKFEDLPTLFKQDKWFSFYELRQTRISGKQYYNDKYFANLINCYIFMKAVEDGTIEICMTETPLNFALQNDVSKNFVEKFVTALTVPEEHSKEFLKKRRELVKEYLKSGAIEQEYYPDGNARCYPFPAVYVAEATLFGIFLMVKSVSKYIHKDCVKKDCYRTDLIAFINERLGYFYPTIDGQITPITAKTIGNIIKNLTRIKHNQNLNFPPFTSQNNIDEDNNFVLK